MKDYLGQAIDLTSDSYLNPVPAIYNNGQHIRNEAIITSISVHHDAVTRPHDYDSVARYKQEAKQHYLRLGPGLQYHYKIDNVGQIFKIRPHNTWLYSVGSEANTSCIAICLDGYFHPDVNQKPTREQYEALRQLLDWLCTQNPQFPADQADVYSHSSYSSTACCGDTLRPFVNSYRESGGNVEIPTDSVYDWPEYQPAPPPPATPVPAPTITYQSIPPARYVAQVKTHLDDIQSGQRVKDYEPGEEFDMVQRALYNGSSWLQTPYSVAKTPGRGIPEKDLIIKNPGTPMPPSEPDPNQPPPIVPVPPEPEPPQQDHDYDKENNELLREIKELLQWLVEKIRSIFK